MKKSIDTEDLNCLEKQLSTNIDLLEIAKDYCEFNYDKSSSLSNLLSLLEIVLINQKKAVAELDKVII